MKYRPGWTVFHLPSTIVPSARALLAAAAAVGVVGDHSAACTRVLLPVAVVLVSLSAPRRARVPPSGVGASRNGRRTRSAGPWRHRGASSSPWASSLLSSGVTAAASTASPSQRWPRAYANVPPRPCPAPPCSARACLARSVRLSVCILQYNGISAHYCNLSRQNDGSFAQVINESIISYTIGWG